MNIILYIGVVIIILLIVLIVMIIKGLKVTGEFITDYLDKVVIPSQYSDRNKILTELNDMRIELRKNIYRVSDRTIVIRDVQNEIKHTNNDFNKQARSNLKTINDSLISMNSSIGTILAKIGSKNNNETSSPLKGEEDEKQPETAIKQSNETKTFKGKGKKHNKPS